MQLIYPGLRQWRRQHWLNDAVQHDTIIFDELLRECELVERQRG